MLRLADRAEVRAVASNPVRYLVPEDAFLADALECMREIVPIAANHVSRTNAEGWLKPAEAMRLLFAERPDLCDTTLEIADSCRFDLGLKQVHFPDFPTPAGRSADAILAERCWTGVHDRGTTEDERLRERLHLELSMIRRMGYAAFFLTVADIVADIRAMGIHVACRGSAAGSLVCYLLRISDVDALRHDLSFERFLNPMRDELPDIDIDVESARREDIYDMVLSRHGDERTGCVAMIDTYRARSAVREVGKALGLPEVEVGMVAKSFPHISARNLRESLTRLPELDGINLPMAQLELLFRVAERLDGFPRHIALHPCGIVLSSHDLVDRVPLERSANGHRMIQADKDDVELLGYLKLDVLGVRMLSSMRHAMDEIARTMGEKVDLERIPLDDEPTFEMIRDSDTLGCFQIESPGQRELLQKLQPNRWEDLIVDISLFRPGPVKSDMITPYLRRRAALERPVYIHPERATGPAGDVRRDRLPRAGDADARRGRRLGPHLRRPRPQSSRSRGAGARLPRGVPPARGGTRRRCRGRREDLGRRRAVRLIRLLQGARGGVRGPDVSERLVEDALSGAFHGRDPHARPRDVPAAGAPGRRAPPRHPDPAAGRERERARVHGRSDLPGRGRCLRHPVGRSKTSTASPTRRSVRSSMARADKPFASVEDFLARTSVARPVVEALAHAGAFDGLPGTRTNRRGHLFDGDDRAGGT